MCFIFILRVNTHTKIYYYDYYHVFMKFGKLFFDHAVYWIKNSTSSTYVLLFIRTNTNLPSVYKIVVIIGILVVRDFIHKTNSAIEWNRKSHYRWNKIVVFCLVARLGDFARKQSLVCLSWWPSKHT